MAKHPDIYATAEWQSSRQFVIIRANGLCEMCSAAGKVMKGKDVDHIIELTDENKHDWDIAYNPDNLRYLCDEHHQQRHGRGLGNGLQNFLSPPMKRVNE